LAAGVSREMFVNAVSPVLSQPDQDDSVPSCIPPAGMPSGKVSFPCAPLLLCPRVSDTLCSLELSVCVAETPQRIKEPGRMCLSYWFPQTWSARCKPRCHKASYLGV